MRHDKQQKQNKYISLFDSTSSVQEHLPLRFEDSLTSIPNYPLCTLGMLTAEAQWGTQKSIAFVVEDRFLLTCASSCYSYKHGQYSNITFTIDSNRKHGYGTYTVEKMFIPQLYKYSSQSNRKEFNYALLKIAGQPCLKDKYGFTEIKTRRHCFQGPTYEENVFNSIQQIDMGEQLLQKYPSVCLSGTPILYESQQNIQASGFLIEKNKSQFSILYFTHDMKKQLCLSIAIELYQKQMIFHYLAKIEQIKTGTQYQRTKLSLSGLKSEDLNRKYFSFIFGQSGQLVELVNSELNQQQFRQFFDDLPFKSISHLTISNNINSLSFDFLYQEKFQSLKVLSLRKCKIDSIGCKNIKAASLINLRVLLLSQSSIGKEGWMYLSEGKWLCLQKIEIENCDIMHEGLKYLLRNEIHQSEYSFVEKQQTRQ